MDIIRLPAGQRASDDVDCISVQRRPDGLYDVRGSALINCSDSDEVESVSLIDLPPYASLEEAESVGLAWAAEQCVERVYLADTEFSIDA